MHQKIKFWKNFYFEIFFTSGEKLQKFQKFWSMHCKEWRTWENCLNLNCEQKFFSSLRWSAASLFRSFLIRANMRITFPLQLGAQKIFTAPPPLRFADHVHKHQWSTMIKVPKYQSSSINSRRMASYCIYLHYISIC